MAKKKRTRRTWNADEIAFIDANYEIDGVVACARKLNRGEGSVYIKAKERGLISESYYYSDSEIGFISKHAKKGIKWLAKKMGRTERSIGKKAQEHGIHVRINGGEQKRKRWTDKDNALILDSNLSNDELASMLDRSKQAIATQKSMLRKK